MDDCYICIFRSISNISKVLIQVGQHFLNKKRTLITKKIQLYLKNVKRYTD